MNSYNLYYKAKLKSQINQFHWFNLVSNLFKLVLGLPGFTGFYRVLPVFTGFYRVLRVFTRLH